MKFTAKIGRNAQAALLTAASMMVFMGSATQAAASDGLYSVQINKTEVVRLPAEASAVIVGNPDIADVSIHASDTIFVIGKGYGETNLVILDKAGNTIMNSSIQVITPQSRNQVRIFNAASGRQTYNCGPSCNPSPTLGDSEEFVTGNTASNSDPLSNLFAAAANSSRSAMSGDSPGPQNTPN